MTVRAYAGIGSRTITSDEAAWIKQIAERFAAADFTCYSGHAEGSDVAFERASFGKCVLLLPWKNFNKVAHADVECLDRVAVGDTEQGQASIARFHPAPGGLTNGGRLMMARNWHQVVGHGKWPAVEFVVCCANVDAAGDVVGGTGQACRIAESRGIQVINLRNGDRRSIDELIGEWCAWRRKEVQ